MSSDAHDALRVLAEELQRPVNRLLGWVSDLVAFRIDWRSFGRTRGGFFGPFGIPVEYIEWPGGRPPPEPETLVATGGICAPMTTYSFGGSDGWDPWRLWYCAYPWRMDLPTVSVERAAIHYRQ